MDNIPELLPQNKIGEGSFGIVYKSFYQDQEVAVKKISLQRVWMLKMKTQLQREIQLMKRLNHPNIVRCYNAPIDSKKQFQYIILELCQCNLKQYIFKNRAEFQTNTKLKIKISLQIVNALSFLKRNRIANRDIKMENIVIKKIGKNYDDIIVKLTDFGEARQFINACETRWDVGTPGYMSPEVHSRELMLYDQNCDLWSVGIVIFQIFQGLDHNISQLQQGQFSWPFKANLSLKKASEITKFYQQYINYPLFLSATIPHSLRKVLNGLLKKQPENRISLIEITKIFMDSEQQLFINFSDSQIKEYYNYFLDWNTQQKQLQAQKLSQQQLVDQILGVFTNVICVVYKALNKRKKQVKYCSEAEMLKLSGIKETCIFFCKIYQKVIHDLSELKTVYYWKQEDINDLFPKQNPISFQEITKSYCKYQKQFKQIGDNPTIAIDKIKQFIRIYCSNKERTIILNIQKYQLFK